MLKKYAEVWRGIKDQILKINGSVGEYDKGYVKIKFDSDNNLRLVVVLKFCILTIVIRCIFEKDGKYYPQIFLDDSLYELQMLEFERIHALEGIDVYKSRDNQKNLIFVIIGIFLIKTLIMSLIFATAVTI